MFAHLIGTATKRVKDSEIFHDIGMESFVRLSVHQEDD